MAEVISFAAGGYRYVKGVFQYSAGVAAEPGFEIERVRSGGVTAAELRRCQVRLKAAKRMGLQTNGARAMSAALNGIYGLPVNDWRDYDARVDAVTLADIQAFARRYFDRGQRVQLVVKL